MLSQPQLALTGQILLGILCTVAAVYDMRFRRIPNWLVLAGLTGGLVWNLLADTSHLVTGLGHWAAGLGLGFILYFPLYLLRARGAGDVKLLAAVGAVTGPANCFWIFLLTAVLGGIVALLVLLIAGRLRKTLFNVSWILRDLLRLKAPYQASEELDVNTDKGLRLPHGALIFIGVTAFLLMIHVRITF